MEMGGVHRQEKKKALLLPLVASSAAPYWQSLNGAADQGEIPLPEPWNLSAEGGFINEGPQLNDCQTPLYYSKEMLWKFSPQFQPPVPSDSLSLGNLSNRSQPSVLKILQISLPTYISTLIYCILISPLTVLR